MRRADGGGIVSVVAHSLEIVELAEGARLVFCDAYCSSEWLAAIREDGEVPPGEPVFACKQDPRRTARWYGPLKNRRRRFTVLLPTEIWEPLEERARALLERFGQEDEDRGMAALIFPQNDHNLVRVPNPPSVANAAGGKSHRWEDQDLWERASFARVLAKPAMTAAGWPDELDWNCHRHHFAVWARDELRWAVEDISRCMGHANTELTMKRYFISSVDANNRLIEEHKRRQAGQ